MDHLYACAAGFARVLVGEYGFARTRVCRATGHVNADHAVGPIQRGEVFLL